MIISDLTYCDDVLEASRIEGGGLGDVSTGYGKVFIIVNSVSQSALNIVKVSTLNGDANAVANALNKLKVNSKFNFL
jgi:hypothetical protein